MTSLNSFCNKSLSLVLPQVEMIVSTAALAAKSLNPSPTALSNRGFVTACAAVAVALLVGAVAFAWQARAAGVERDAAVSARNAEERERNKAQELAASETRLRALAQSSEQKAAAVNQFLLDMLGSANVRQLGHEVKVSQALDRAAAGVGKSFADRPDVEAAVRRILGRTYLSIGDLDAAGTQIEAALGIEHKLDARASAEYGRCLGDLRLNRGHAICWPDEPSYQVLRALRRRFV